MHERCHVVTPVNCGRPAGPPDRRVTWGSMLVCSSGAVVSSGGMVMDRLGGFRLCRRLLDTEDTLSPFLSVEAMAGRREGAAKQKGGMGAQVC